jgi:type VI secretion system protein ImpA
MNIDALLAPISELAPCGEDLSFSADFDTIAELRREDDPTLDQGDWVTTLKVADWAAVQSRCEELLSTRSKDLRLVMWFSEASTLNHGYAGLKQGLELCARVCERYWESLHPLAEDGDMEERVGNISWFLSRVSALSTRCPVTRGRGGQFTLQQLQMARALQSSIDRSADKSVQPPADAVTLDKFNRALRETPKEALRETLDILVACQAALAAWQGVIDDKLGADGPSFVAAREALASALHETQRLAREVGAVQAEPSKDAAVTATESTASSAGEPAAGSSGGPIRSRVQALAQLRDVAAFFRATEPHSPVAYLADKAVQWGDMPLHLWLRAVVKDSGALAHLEEMLGLEARPEGDTASGS